jgi:hypothetical protein
MIDPKFDASRLEGSKLGIGKGIGGIGKAVTAGRKQAVKNYKQGTKEITKLKSDTSSLIKSGQFGDIKTPEGREKLEEHLKTNQSPLAVKTALYNQKQSNKAVLSQQKKIRRGTARFVKSQKPLGPIAKAITKAKIKGLETIINAVDRRSSKGPEWNDRRNESKPSASKSTTSKPKAAKPPVKAPPRIR